MKSVVVTGFITIAFSTRYEEETKRRRIRLMRAKHVDEAELGVLHLQVSGERC